MFFTVIILACLVSTFFGWYLLGAVRDERSRNSARALLVALLCSPGVLVGHGIGVAPGVYALFVQPGVFSIGPILVVWLIAMAVIFNTPALRAGPAWPYTWHQIFVAGHPAKFLLYGVTAVVALNLLSYGGMSRWVWPVVASDLFMLGCALANLLLCQRAEREKSAQVWTIPLWFALPALIVATPTLFAFWYAAGVTGSLWSDGRHATAARVATGALGVLAALYAWRIQLAATAASHVHIPGGVTGNLILSVVCVVAALLAWRAAPDR